MAKEISYRFRIRTLSIHKLLIHRISTEKDPYRAAVRRIADSSSTVKLFDRFNRLKFL